MLKPNLVVTTQYLPAIEERLERDFEVHGGADGVKLSRLALLELSDGADAMFITPMDRIDAEFFENVSSSVKVIATNSVGLDHIDLEAAAARKIAIGYCVVLIIGKTSFWAYVTEDVRDSKPVLRYQLYVIGSHMNDRYYHEKQE